jgi:hypothetical protein
MTAPAAAVPAGRGAHPQRAARWATLLLLCLAPILLVALTQDIGAHAYDAATEHIYRGVAFSAAIDDGAIYPRWSQALHWGLGSPLFTFQPPLPYYGMDLLYRFGVPHALGWRVLMALGYALAFLGAYLLVRILGGTRTAGLVAAIAYVYAPYVIRNGLERGSNEAYSMFLYPLVLWSLIWLAERPNPGRFALATGIWAACIACHVLGPLMLAPVAGVLALVLWVRGCASRKRSPAPLLALLAGALLTAFIWAPMGGPWGSEQAWVHIERDFNKPEAMPAENPLQPGDLLAPPAVYDVMRDNNKTGDRVGLAQSVLLLLGIPGTIYLWSRNRRLAWAIGAATAIGLFLFFLFTPWSDWLWRLGGALAARLLYRTRLMGLQALAAAVVAGLMLVALPPRARRIVGAVLGAVLLVLALPSLYVQHQHAFADFDAAPGLDGVRAMEIRHGGTALTAFGEFTPRWRTAPFDETLLNNLGPDFDPQARPLANPEGEVSVRTAEVNDGAWDLRLDAPVPVTATLHLLYYPRWQATLDGRPVALVPQAETGYGQFALPEGEHDLALRYGSTAAETGGLVVSAVTLLALLIFAIVRLARPRRGQAVAPRATSAGAALADTGGRVSPSVWLLAGLAGLLVLKVAVIDPHTTLFRCVSSAGRVCGADTTATASFAGAPALRGYSIASYNAKAGDPVELTLYWQVDAPLDHSLASFVHVRPSTPEQATNPASPNGMWAQEEHRSWDGLLGSELVPGKLYADSYRFDLPKEMPAGKYFLEFGWFDPVSGEQADTPEGSAQPPLRILWRSVLLPDLNVAAADHE